MHVPVMQVRQRPGLRGLATSPVRQRQPPLSNFGIPPPGQGCNLPMHDYPQVRNALLVNSPE